MDDDYNRMIKFYKKRIEPFIAILILTFVVVGCYIVYEDNQLKKEISKNCGWETEDYICYCDKSYVDMKKWEKNQGEISKINLNFSDIKNDS